MQAKKILYGDAARLKIKEGVDAVADAVKSTLGPRGRNVVFEQPGNPIITNDGVTIAREIILEDKFANLGCSLIKEAAIKTNDDAGDGTTTATLFVQKMVEDGYKYIQMGINPMIMKYGMIKAVDQAIAALRKIAKPIESKEQKIQIATISANNDQEIGKLVGGLIHEVSHKGVVSIKRSEEVGVRKEIVKGLKIEQPLVSPFMITNRERLRAEATNVKVVLTTEDVSSEAQILPLAELLVGKNIREFVLIARSIEQEALVFLIKNFIQGKFRCYAVKAPSFGDYQVELMNDIGSVVKAKLIGADTGTSLKEIKFEDIGACESFVSDKDKTILSGGKGDVLTHIKGLEKLLAQTKDIYKKEKIKDRIGALMGGVAIIHVGAYSETEQQEIHYRIEDALLAAKAAVEEGIVPGGGKAFCDAYLALDERKIVDEEERAGFLVVKKALLEPLRQIALNAGRSADKIVDSVLDKGVYDGWDARKNQFCDMITTGIIDPLKVVRNALENAASTAAIILTTNTSITFAEDQSKEKR